MSSIKSKNTLPELTVRKILWSMGKRYRIHDKTIFGKPDISNKGQRLVVFIDGCFWHGCRKCTSLPKTNSSFWKEKIKNNKRRRKEVVRVLTKDEWKILSFWEHEIKNDPNSVSRRIASFL